MIEFTRLDWVWTGAFLLLMVGGAFLFYRLARRSESDFFLAGRGLPEQPPVMAGGRITEWVAGTFAAVAAAAAARRARQTGQGEYIDFSLLEVMIALSVLAVGVLGISAGQLASMKLSSDSRAKTEAAFFAQQQIEAFQAMPSSAVTDLLTDSGYPNDPNNPHRRWIIQPDTPEAGVITITVEVDYVNNLGRTRTVRVRTMKAES